MQHWRGNFITRKVKDYRTNIKHDKNKSEIQIKKQDLNEMTEMSHVSYAKNNNLVSLCISDFKLKNAY